MNRTHLIYYIGFPLVTFSLCAFSYYLGLNRGRQEAPAAAKPEIVFDRGLAAVPHEVREDLEFFKTLRAPHDQEMAKEIAAQKDPKKEKRAATQKPTLTELTSKSAPSKGTLVVQVSAFRDIGRAHELIDELKNRGFLAFVPNERRKKDDWHRVFVGPFETREAAEKCTTNLSKNGFGTGFITERDAVMP